MRPEERKILIPLAIAHVNQYTTSKGKSQWEVQENETNELLAKLPSNFTDSEMFEVLHFARKYELNALDIGMKHMHKELISRFEIEKANLLKVINDLEAANSRLAEKLGTFIGEEE